MLFRRSQKSFSELRRPTRTIPAPALASTPAVTASVVPSSPSAPPAARSQPAAAKPNVPSSPALVSQPIDATLLAPGSGLRSGPGVTLEPELELPAAMSNVSLGPSDSCDSDGTSGGEGGRCSDDVTHCAAPFSPSCARARAAKRHEPPTAPSPPVSRASQSQSPPVPVDAGVDAGASVRTNRPNRVLLGHHKAALYMMNKLAGAGMSLW